MTPATLTLPLCNVLNSLLRGGYLPCSLKEKDVHILKAIIDIIYKSKCYQCNKLCVNFSRSPKITMK